MHEGFGELLFKPHEIVWWMDIVQFYIDQNIACKLQFFEKGF